MSIPSLSPTNEAAPIDTNQALCADLSLLFKTLLVGLSDVIARTGGKPLSDQFTKQLNHYAGQHAWQALTGLADLSQLGQRLPDVNARILLSVYRSYARQAQLLARQILGEYLLKSTMATLLSQLPPQLAALNEQYGLICL
ncbi:MAG: hypothetical protein HY870_13885 [Chloroflexi bacterium]|nr:hypothetical protein [Chloroflexota bacterium]